MEQNENMLGTQPVGKLLVKLAAPAITAQVINALYNIVDRVYIGRLPQVGTLALAALGVSFPLIMIISAFAGLIGMGGAPRASIAMGAGKKEKAEEILGNSFVLLMFISLALTTLFLTFQEPLLILFGAMENTITMAKSYFSIYILGTISVQMALGLNAFISSQGFAKVSMSTVIIGAITNIVLDPILIYGFGMGIRGAAIATVISQTISALWVLAFLFGPKTILKLHPKNFKVKKEIVLPIIALGVSPFIMQSTESLVQLAFNSGLKRYGGSQVDQLVGSMAVILSVMQLVSLPLIGLTQGAQPIVSYNYGAQKMDRVKQAFRYLLMGCLTFSCTMFALCQLVPQIFVKIFSSDPALLESTVSMLRIFMLGIFAMGAQMACQQTFVALGQAKVSMFLALLRKIILLIPMAIVLPIFWGVTGILVAEPVADILAATTTVVMFTRFAKKNLKTEPLAEPKAAK